MFLVWNLNNPGNFRALTEFEAGIRRVLVNQLTRLALMADSSAPQDPVMDDLSRLMGRMAVAGSSNSSSLRLVRHGVSCTCTAGGHTPPHLS